MTNRIWSKTTGTVSAKDIVRDSQNDNPSHPPVRLDDTSSHVSSSPLVVASAHVTMSELVEWTLAHNLLPKVITEFASITVGGAIAGGGIESSSYRYGLFSDTIAWMQVSIQDTEDSNTRVSKITRRGDKLWCNLSSTFGVHGIIMEAAIECLVVESRFVKVSYYSVPTVERVCYELMTMSQKFLLSRNDNAEADVGCFLDGLQFPREFGFETCSAVIMAGRILSKNEVRNYSRGCNLGWTRPKVGGSFYFEHVVNLVKKYATGITNTSNDDSNPFTEELLDISDYLFRYDPGAFWMARPMTFQWRNILSYFPFTLGLFVVSHRWTRYLTGWLFSSTRRLYTMLHSVPQRVIASKMILQDFYLPPTKASLFLNQVRNEITCLTTPIWLCPVKANHNQPFTPSFSAVDSMLINCGVYGRVPDNQGRYYTRRLEEDCVSMGGRKMLYAQSYYTRSQFYEVYGHSALASQIYDKTCLAPQSQFIASKYCTWKEWIASRIC